MTSRALMVNAADRIARNPRVAFHPLSEGNGGVLLHLDTGAYHGINAVGLLIWQILEGPSSLDELIETCRSRVDDPPATLETEIAGFVSELVARDLLSTSPQETVDRH